MSDDNGNSPSGSGSQQPPTIAFTRKRTTTKTRTAASSARRRKNIPLCHASGGGEDTSGKEHSWFARKASAWTDDDIRDHVVSGGATRGGEGVSIVGDVVMGVKEEKKKSDQQRRGGPRFAWEEEDEVMALVLTFNNQRMAAAPMLFDIMDEQDNVDYLAPSQVYRVFDANMESIFTSPNNCFQRDRQRLTTTNRLPLPKHPLFNYRYQQWQQQLEYTDTLI
jgi:hypothetical protein